jgi:AcrR family transcriptional regulator
MIEANSDTGARQKILKAARKLFSEKGFHSASMADIAQEAGVNKALLFYYFSSKKNLYSEILKDLFANFSQEIENRLAGVGDVEERLCRIIRYYSNHMVVNRDIANIIMREFLGLGPGLPFSVEEIIKRARQPLILVLEEGIRQGRFVQLDPAFISDSVVGILHMFYSKIGFWREPGRDDEEIFCNIIQLLKHGIVARSA